MHCFEAINLSKAYGQRRVVDRVSLKVENDIVGILGPNGAGKTTTFSRRGLDSKTGKLKERELDP